MDDFLKHPDNVQRVFRSIARAGLHDEFSVFCKVTRVTPVISQSDFEEGYAAIIREAPLHDLKDFEMLTRVSPSFEFVQGVYEDVFDSEDYSSLRMLIDMYGFKPQLGPKLESRYYQYLNQRDFDHLRELEEAVGQKVPKRLVDEYLQDKLATGETYNLFKNASRLGAVISSELIQGAYLDILTGRNFFFFDQLDKIEQITEEPLSSRTCRSFILGLADKYDLALPTS